jgi:hypothetical protein
MTVQLTDEVAASPARERHRNRQNRAEAPPASGASVPAAEPYAPTASAAPGSAAGVPSDSPQSEPAAARATFTVPEPAAA